MDRGPSGSSSHFGAEKSVSGEASGSMPQKAKALALPADAPAAGPVRSMTRTPRPRAMAAWAMESPITPAPITTRSVREG